MPFDRFLRGIRKLRMKSLRPFRARLIQLEPEFITFFQELFQHLFFLLNSYYLFFPNAALD
jgi:hypothetical protein